MVDQTIRFFLDVDGSQAVKEFNNVKEASQGVLDNIKNIKDSTSELTTRDGDFFTDAETTVNNSFNKIREINKRISNSPTYNEHDLSNLYQERELLRRSIDATLQDVRSYAEASKALRSSLSSMSDGGNFSFKAISDSMSQMLSFVGNVVEFQRKASTVMDVPMFKSAIKNQLSDAGMFEKLGFSKSSKQADYLSEMLMYQGAGQVQRGNFVKAISAGSESQKHMFESFAQMLPDAFKDFHEAKGTTAVSADKKALSNAEKNIIEGLLRTNPYFAKAAEQANVAVRFNGNMGMRNGITRDMINAVSGNLYDVIINSAKGMPMYGITDVDDPDNWERISRKNNKPILGAMRAARTLSDNFAWLNPGRRKSDTIVPLSEYSDIGKIGFSPLINRYEVAKYTLEDLKNGRNLNGRKRQYDEDPNHDSYFSLDHSLHLENIFRHRKNGKMPVNNEAVNDLFYLALDERLADPKLDENVRKQIESEYANWISTGITKNVFGKDVHYSFTRAHKGLGLEFVADPIYNAITNNGKDKSFFRGGLPDNKTLFTGDKAYESMAKAVEYASKNATSGESIESLYGSRLPDNLKIAIFDLEEIAKNGNNAAGMNGQSYINAKYTGGKGGQARAPGIKTALNSLDMKGFLSYFGGRAKTVSPTGEVEELTDDIDLLLSWSDIKNAGIKYTDEKGDYLPLAQIKDNIRKQINEAPGKIFVNRTMDDANGNVRWLSRQFAQVLKGDERFTAMTTKAFLDEYARAGTMEGALDTVFSGESEIKDLILSTNGAILGDRRIQDRINEYRMEMLSRISKGDVILPKELESKRAMAAPLPFNAIISGMKSINAAGTGLKKETDTSSYYDTLMNNLSAEQRETLGLITLEDDEVAFQDIMASVLGIGRYPSTSRSARKVKNAIAGNSKRAKTLRKALEDSGLDTNAFYISPSSPIMDMLQDADFDGDVMELIGLAYTGKNKKGQKVTAAEILNQAYEKGMERIDKLGLSDSERKAREDKLKHLVYSGDRYDYNNPNDIMKVISAMMQDGAFMGAPDAVIRNAANIPWSKDVLKAMADAESQYSINSVRGKKGSEMSSSAEEIEIMTKYRPFTEFFNLVDKNRDKYGNISEPDLIEATKNSNGVAGARFWNTNLPFNTMSSNNMSMMLSRYLARQKGANINKNYDWNYIFDTVLGKKDESTALGRMQSALRDTWMGYLNADYLAIDDETVAKLGELRSLAIDEQQALVKKERDRLGPAFEKKGSNYSIAQNIVDTLGGRVISNAVAGMALTTSSLKNEGIAPIFDTLNALGFSGVTGNLDFSKLVEARTNPEAFKSMSAATKNTQMYRLVTQLNLLNEGERKRLVDNMPRLSFSTMEKFAYDPASFLSMVLEGREQEVSGAPTEIGQAAHAAIEHFMRRRMTAGNQLDDKQLKAAQKEAVEVFDEYLGLTPLKNLKEIESRGLNDAERAELKTEGTNLNQRYNKLKRFLSSKSLLDIYPENEWEVVGIESSDVGKGDKTPGGRMKIHGMGEQLTNPNEVGFSGAYDLRFRNRNTGKEVVADIKNYWNPGQKDWEKWRVQQQLYTKQLIDNGVPIEEIGIIMPYQNQIKQMAFSSQDLTQTGENTARSVSAMQQAISNGNVTVQSILNASKFVRETMFGEVGNGYQDQFAERRNQKGFAKFNSGMITDALFMHDRYNDAIEAEEDILKFVNKKTRPRDSKFDDAQMWRAKYNQAENIFAQSELEEQAGNSAQAADLQSRYYATIGRLNSGLAEATVLDEMNFGEDVRRSIKGYSGNKEVQSLIKEYQGTIDTQQNNAKQRELIKEKIDEANNEIKSSTETIDKYDAQISDFKKENNFYQKIEDYNKRIQTALSTGNTKSASALKAARTKYISSNQEFKNQEEFLPILSALEQKTDEGERIAAEATTQRRATIKERLDETQKIRNEEYEQREAKKADVSSMDLGLLASETKAEENKPFVEQYLQQIRSSAMRFVESTFESLSSQIDGESKSSFNTKDVKEDFKEQVNNARTDIIDLYNKNIIPESELTNRLNQYNEMLSDESLYNVEKNAINKKKEELGIRSKTPSEKADNWYKERLDVIKADLKADEDIARKRYLEAEYDPQSTLQERTRLLEAWETASAKVSEESPEQIQLQQQRYALEQMWTEQELRPLSDFQRSLDRTALTRSDYIKNTVNDMKSRALQMATNPNLSEDVRSQWMTIVNDQGLWDKQKQFAGEDFDKRESMAEFQHSQRMSDLQFQQEQNQRARDQSYLQHNRNRFGQSTSRFVNAYRSNRDYWASLKQSYGQSNHSAIKEQANISRLEKEIAGMGKTQQEREKHQDYKARNRELEESREKLTEYQNAAADAQAQMSKFTRPAAIMNSAFQSINGTVNTLIMRFGRQLFSSVLRETTNFVKQFDASMNTIQMITLKSNEEIDKLGDSLIDKAKDLKISVYEISQSAATLYRQGLSDQEVDERLEVISKFSKVSGTKVDAATKLITVAMNTGLVQQAEEASDIVTALGDNAATNAAEIEKGIEKAGAAAAADGTTFAELSAMLTAITSTTQIGGNVAGRTLNTIFGRMNKIGTNELIYDENGNAVSGSAVAKLLEAEGIKMYDENGNKRSTYETLYALSQKWEGLSDAKQQQLANAIAGTRQYSNFAAIMQGMSEGKVDQYMQLAGEAGGITDKKYEIYTKSLDASLTDLRNNWDGLVHDMTDSGALGGFVGTITSMIQGVDNLTGSIGGLGAALSAAIPMYMVLSGLKMANPVGWGMAAVGGIGMLGLSLLGNNKSAQDAYEAAIKEANERYSSRSDEIARARELQAKGTERTEDETAEYEKLLNKFNLTVQYSDIEQGVEADKRRRETLVQNASEIIDQTEKRNNANRIKAFIGQKKNITEAASKEIDQLMTKYDTNGQNLDNEKTALLFANVSKENPLTIKNLHDDSVIGQAFADATVRESLMQTIDNAIAGQFTDALYGTGEDAVFKLEEGQTKYDLFGNGTENDYLRKWFYDNITTNWLQGDQEQKEKFLSYLTTWYKQVSPQGVRYQTEYDKVNELFAGYISDNVKLEPDQIETLAQFATEGYFSELKNNNGNIGDAFWSQLATLFGINGQEITQESVEEALSTNLKKARGFDKREEMYKELDLEDAGEGGYYIDLTKQLGQEGYRVSSSEAIKNVKEYRERKKDQTAVYDVYDTETGETVASFSAKDYGSAEEAKKQAEITARTRWYVEHPDGTKQYTDNFGKPFTLRSATNEYARIWDEKNGTWSTDITSIDPNAYYGSITYGTSRKTITAKSKEALEIASLKELERQRATQYGLIMEGETKPFDIKYGEKEDVEQAVATANMRERQNAELRAQAARIAEDNATTAYFINKTLEGEYTYVDENGNAQTGKKFEVRGKENVKNLYGYQQDAVEDFMKRYNWDGKSELYRYYDETTGNQTFGTQAELNEKVANVSKYKTKVDGIKQTISALNAEIAKEEEISSALQSEMEDVYSFITPNGEIIESSGNVGILAEQQAYSDRSDFLRNNPYALYLTQKDGLKNKGDFYGYTTNANIYRNLIAATRSNGLPELIDQKELDNRISNELEKYQYTLYKGNEPVEYFQDENAAKIAKTNKTSISALTPEDKKQMIGNAFEATDIRLTIDAEGKRITDRNGNVLIDENGDLNLGNTNEFLSTNVLFKEQYNPYNYKETTSEINDNVRAYWMNQWGMSYLVNQVPSKDYTSNPELIKSSDETYRKLQESTKRLKALTDKRAAAETDLINAQYELDQANTVQKEYKPVRLDKNGRVVFGEANEELIGSVIANYASPIEYEGAKQVNVWDRKVQIAEPVLQVASTVRRQQNEVSEPRYEESNYTEPAPQYKTIKDYFLSNAVSSYNSWLTDAKNAYATNADEMLRLITSSGTKDLQGLLRTINEYKDANGEIKGIKEWNSLYQNSEFGRILGSIKTDEYGNILNDETTQKQVFDQIVNFLSSNGRDYGQISATAVEKAQKALQAYQGLRGFDKYGNKLETGAWYVSEEAREKAIDKEYQAYIEKETADYRRRIDEYKAKGLYAEADIQQRLMNDAIAGRLMSREDFDKRNNIGYLDTVSEEDLSGIIGSDLLRKVKLAREGGQQLTKTEESYIMQRLNNARYGISGLTKQEQLEGLAKFQQMSAIDRARLIQQSPEIVGSWFEGYSDRDKYLYAIQRRDMGASLTDDDRKAIEAAEKYLKDEQQKYNFKYTNDKNGSKLLQNFTTLLEGDALERISTFTSYGTQAQEIQQAAYGLMNGPVNSSEQKALASLIGLSDQDIRSLSASDAGKAKLEDLLKEKSLKLVEEFAKSFNVNIDSDLKTNLRNAVAAKSPELLNTVDTLLDSLTGLIADAEGKLHADGFEEKTESGFGNLYEDALTAAYGKSNDLRTAMWYTQRENEIKSLVGKTGAFDEGKYLEEAEKRSQRRDKYEEEYDKKHKNEKIPDEEKRKAKETAMKEWDEKNPLNKEDFMTLPHTLATAMMATAEKYAKELGINPETFNESFWTEERAIMQSAQQAGLVSQSDLDKFIMRSAVGGKLDSSYINKFKSSLFGDVFTDKGTIKEGADLTQLVTLRQRYAADTSEKGKATAALIDLLFSSDSNLADLYLSAQANMQYGEEIVTKKDLEDQRVGYNEKIVKEQTEEKYKNRQHKTKNNDEIISLLRSEKPEDQVKAKALMNEDFSTFVNASAYANQAKDDKGNWKAGKELGLALKKQLKSILGLTGSNWKKEIETMSASDVGAAFSGALDTKAVNNLFHDTLKTKLEEAGYKGIYEELDPSLLEYDEEKGKFDMTSMLTGAGVKSEDAKSINEFYKNDMENLIKDKRIKINYDETGYNKSQQPKKVNAQREIDRTIQGTTAFKNYKKDYESKYLTNTQSIPSTAVEQMKQGLYKSFLSSDIGKQIASTVTSTVTAGINKTQQTKSGQSSKISFLSVLNGENNNNTYSGGGGGGKAKAAQDAINKAKRALVEPEHELKMAETSANVAKYTNNAKAYNESMQKQADIYQDMGKLYEDNITNLKNTRDALDSNSDEYWSVTEAINSYTEALEELKTKIYEINASKIEFTQEEQDIADAVQTRELNISSADKDYSKLIEDYDKYRKDIVDIIANKTETKEQNVTQLAQWKEEYERIVKEEGETSDNAEDLRNKINDIEVEQITIEQELVETIRELNATEQEILEKELSRATEVPNAKSNVATSAASYFANIEDYVSQRSQLRSSASAKQTELEARQAQSANLWGAVTEDLRASDPDAWSQALQDAVNNDLAVIELSNGIIEDYKNTAMSYLTEITNAYEDSTRAATHFAEVSATIADIYKTGYDFEGYRNNLLNSIKLNNFAIQQLDEYIEDLKKLRSATEENSAEYRDYTTSIENAENEKFNKIKSQQDQQIAYQKSVTEQVKTTSNLENILPNTQSSVAGTYGNMYKTNGEWGNYEEMLRKQITAEQQMRDNDLKAYNDIYSKLTGKKGDSAEEQSAANKKIREAAAKRDSGVAAQDKIIADSNAGIQELQARKDEIEKRLLTGYDLQNSSNSEYDKQMRDIQEKLSVAGYEHNEKLDQLEARHQKEMTKARRAENGGSYVSSGGTDKFGRALYGGYNPSEKTKTVRQVSDEFFKDLQEEGDRYNAEKGKLLEELYALQKGNDDVTTDVDDLMRQRSEVEAELARLQNNISKANSEKSKLEADYTAAYNDAKARLEEAFYTEADAWLDAYQSLADLAKTDAEHAQQLFNYVSELQDVARQKAEYDVTHKNIAQNAVTQAAGVYAGIYGKTHRYGEQGEVYNESFEQRQSKIENLEGTAQELYADIMSHDERNPWVSQKVKDDAINSYVNIINQLNSEIASSIQDRYDAQAAHHAGTEERNNDEMRWINQRTAMNQAVGNIYLSNEDFREYRNLLSDTNDNLRDSIAQRQKHIEELKIEQELFKDNPDLLRQVTDEINSEMVAIATDTKALQDNTKAIEANRLAQLELMTTRSNLAAQTNTQLASTYAQTAESNWDWEGYRESMAEKTRSSLEQKSNNNIEINTIKSMLDADMFTNQEEKQAAITRYYSLVSENANIDASIESDRKAVLSSNVNEVSNNLNLETMLPNYYNDVYGQWASRYANVGNNAGQREALNIQLGLADTMLSSYQTAASALRKQVAGMERNTPEWYEASQKLIECESAIQRLKITAEETADAIKKTVIEDILRTYDEGARYARHDMNQASTYGSMYNTTLDYEGYRNMLKVQSEDRQVVMSELDKAIASLEAELPGLKGTAEYDTVVKDLYSKKEEQTKLKSDELQNQISMASSKVDEALKNRQKTLNDYTKEVRQATTEAARYLNEGNTDAYTKAIERQTKAIKEKQAYELKELSNMIKLAKVIPTNTDAYEKLEKQIYDAAKAAIQQNRDMLAGTTSTQKQILDIIRENYRKQWELIEKDMNKKKEALNEEKSLINERLQARKDALNQERQDEELEEYQRQLALIESDSSRTKEAKELRKKIQELQQNKAMSIAEQEANYQVESIDDQIKAIDDNIEYKGERINEYLKDANNFREEIDKIVNGSFEDLTAWVAENDENYKNSLDESREEMLNSWRDTWYKMKGVVESYFDEIYRIITSNDIDMAEADIQELINNLVGGVHGADKLVSPDYSADTEYAPNSYNTTTPYLGLESGNEFISAAAALGASNTEATQAFMAAVTASKTSPLNARRSELSNSIASNTEMRDFLRQSLSGMNKESDEYKQTIDAINELNYTIINETAEKQELDKQFNDELSEKMNKAFEASQSAISLMSQIVSNNINDLSRAVGNEGIKEFERTAETLEENRSTIEEFINTLDEGTKASITDLYNNAVKNYNAENKMLTNMSKSVEKSTNTYAKSIATTTDNAANSILNTAGTLKDDISKIEEQSRLDQQADRATTIENLRFVENEYANINKTTIDNATATQTEILSNAMDSFQDSSSQLIQAIGSEQTGLIGELKNLEEVENGIWGAEGTVTSKIDDLSTSESSLTTSVTNLADNIKQAFVDKGSVKDKLETLNGTITTYSGYIKDYSSNVNKYVTDLGKYTTKLNDYTSNINSYVSELKQVAANLAAAKSSGAVSSAASNVSSVSNTATQPPAQAAPDTTTTTTETTTTETTAETETETKNGWVQEGGKWKYYENGVAVTNRLVSSGGYNYYLDENGNMVTNKRLQIGMTYMSFDGEGRRYAGTWQKPSYYAEGGMVDYTGPAWVDGTKTRPEAFLDYYDTKMIQSLVDALNYVHVAPLTLPSSDLYTGGNTSTIGDINITINQAELKSDADYEDVARRVGKAFTKQLIKEGFNLSAYAF